MLNPMLREEDQLRLGRSLYESGFILGDLACMISLYTDLIDKEPVKREMYLETIGTMAKRILHLSRDLIWMNSLAFRRQDPMPTLSINETLPSLLDKSIDRLNEHICAHQLEIVEEIEPNLQDAIPTNIPSRFFDELIEAAVAVAPKGSSVEVSFREVLEKDQRYIQIILVLMKERIEPSLTKDPFQGFTLFGGRNELLPEVPVSGLELLIASLYPISLGGEAKYELTDEKICFEFCFPYESLFGNSSA
jgi:hypothetical protein